MIYYGIFGNIDLDVYKNKGIFVKIILPYIYKQIFGLGFVFYNFLPVY